MWKSGDSIWKILSFQFLFDITAVVVCCTIVYGMPIPTIYSPFHIHARWCHGSSAWVSSVVTSKATWSVILHVVIDLRIPLLPWLPFMCLLFTKICYCCFERCVCDSVTLCVCVCVCVCVQIHDKVHGLLVWRNPLFLCALFCCLLLASSSIH